MQDFEDYTPLDEGEIRNTLDSPIQDALVMAEPERKPHQNFFVRFDAFQN
jgi:hypothetical protein